MEQFAIEKIKAFTVTADITTTILRSIEVGVLGTLKKAIRLIQSEAFILSFLLTIKILGLLSGTLHPLEVALLPVSGSACVGTLISDWRTQK